MRVHSELQLNLKVGDALRMTVMPDKQSIVVVDDDIPALDALSKLLETNGYQVLQPHNGQEALEAMKSSEPPVLILLDLSMPVMDGWEFMRRQRLEPSIAHIPVVVITSLVSAVPAGALISKPINVNRLMLLVQKYCSGAQGLHDACGVGSLPRSGRSRPQPSGPRTTATEREQTASVKAWARVFGNEPFAPDPG
jgi:CheY-like chemotaxis protein